MNPKRSYITCDYYVDATDSFVLHVNIQTVLILRTRLSFQLQRCTRVSKLVMQ